MERASYRRQWAGPTEPRIPSYSMTIPWLIFIAYGCLMFLTAIVVGLVPGALP